MLRRIIHVPHPNQSKMRESEICHSIVSYIDQITIFRGYAVELVQDVWNMKWIRQFLIRQFDSDLFGTAFPLLVINRVINGEKCNLYLL